MADPADIAPPRIQSTYAIVDVMRGRKALAKHIKRHGPVRVLIEATLTEEFGHDDGESIEFCADVHSIRAHLKGTQDDT